MSEAAGAKSQSKFNFFTILEDTITGVIEFALRFVGVTLLCLFRPKTCMARYKQVDELPAGIFPRPYTYLVLCIFVFIKGLHWISQTPVSSDIGTIEDSPLVKIHAIVDKLGDISTLQIILSVFPTIVVILFLSLVVSLLHRPFTEVNYRQSSYAFSYIFGAQIVGAFMLIGLFIGLARMDLFEANLEVASASIIIGVIALAVTSILSLRAWYGLRANNRLSAVGFYLGYVVLVASVSFAFYSTIVAAYTKLESSESAVSGPERYPTLLFTKNLVLSVYRAKIVERRVDFSVLIQNKDDKPFYVHKNASVLVMNTSPNELSNLVSPENPALQRLDLLQNYLELNKHGYGRIALSLTDKMSERETMIDPGENILLSYSGKIPDQLVIGDKFFWVIRLPVAGINQDGRLKVSSLTQTKGLSVHNIDLELEEEKTRIDKEIDESVVEMQKLLDETRAQIDLLLEARKNQENQPTTK